LVYFIKDIFPVIVISLQFFLSSEMFQANFVKKETNSVFIYSENGAIFLYNLKDRSERKSHTWKYNTVHGINITGKKYTSEYIIKIPF